MGGRFDEPPVPLPPTAAVVVALGCDDVVVDAGMDVGVDEVEYVNDDGENNELVEIASVDAEGADVEVIDDVFDPDVVLADCEVRLEETLIGELDGEVEVVTITMLFRVVTDDVPDIVSVPLGLILVALVVEVTVDSFGSVREFGLLVVGIVEVAT